ncbi:PTS sugar transporter subunit IIA [Maledivibacter halophilus]|uniref:PTS system, N-acetylgalactosamine-specific IIA component n=1 Tax=Maledivibacter halophilus TaxID=36842 RepID=A0A1T5I9D7_9FIRM|nr:hypothetical protein [Maledivibacter halophilus]SKC35698.1 PTS system, N-acetylgalactosamine-specific IIA component [Maledivibacter halophilus]
MIGIIIVSHSNMANGIKDAVEMIVGEQENLFSVGYYIEDSLEDLSNNITNIIDNGECDEWIIFTDMFGDTPSNVSAVVTTQKNADVITGVNLVMILEILNMRKNHNKNEIIDQIVNIGKSGITTITKDEIMKNIK